MSTLASEAIVPLHAGFWRRAAAFLLDNVLLSIPALGIALALPEQQNHALLLNLALTGLYFAGFHASGLQATPGKLAFGIKVTDLAGARIGLLRALLRFVASWLSALTFLIGYLMAAFTGRKRALHDLMCGTVVVNRKAVPPDVTAGGGVMPVTFGVWLVMGLVLLLPFFGGMLAAIAIPAYADYRARSEVVFVVDYAGTLRAGVARALAANEPIKSGPVTELPDKVQSVVVEADGRIVTTLTPGLAGGGRIVFTPSRDAAGAIAWKCSGERLPPKYLPASCR